MQQRYLDTETCGFHGVPVLIQHAINRGPVLMHEIWRTPVRTTLNLIDEMMLDEIVGFNLAFDHFHIQKIQNMLALFAKKHPEFDNDKPEDHIQRIASLEKEARDFGCVKPASALDLMLHFRKTKLQITMHRDDVRIRKVPKVLASQLAKLLTERVQLDPILFASQKKWAPHFRVEPLKLDDGTEHPHLRNVVLRFQPGGGLKALGQHLLKHDVMKFTDIMVNKKFRPKEYGYAPFAIGKDAWPSVLKYHIAHWAFREDARKYAGDDVVLTRGLHEHTGWVSGGDTDSVLACCVASCRWKGYKVDLPKLKALVEVYRSRLNYRAGSPAKVKEWINEDLSSLEQVLCWRDGTNKKALKNLIGLWSEEKPEAARKAQEILDARTAKKKIEVLEKLLLAGRFHASFKVIGALSGRMSGTDKLNATGIDKTFEVRDCFPLALDGEDLLGGDMQSFEISIAEADYQDPKLREQLTTCDTCNVVMTVKDGRVRCPKCNGVEAKSFHALFGVGFFPDLGYDGIMATKGLKVGNVYNPCKNGAFATLYGAQPAKLANTIGVSEDEAIEGFHRFWRTYEVAGRKRREVEQRFTSLYNKGTSSKIYYKNPDDAIESLTGYRRYFVLENYLIKELNELATNIPTAWKNLKGKITRSKKGEQSLASAIRSALYGAAFGLQNACIRQAANHRIQSTGAIITKEIQRTIWDFQPVGFHPWLVRPFQVHDEIQCPIQPHMKSVVTTAVMARVESYRPLIPLIGIDFGELKCWSDK